MTSILKVDTIQDTAGNNIINESADTITIGASGDTVNIVGTLQNGGTNFLQGITMADQWRLTTTINGNHGDIIANLERNDTSGFSGIGTGMTESSGVFSFPSTGIYLVTAQAYWYTVTSGVDYMAIKTMFTINNSTYVSHNRVYESAAGADDYAATFTFSILDVTDLANCKVKFNVETSSANSRLSGTTNENNTSFTFIRLGDT